MVELVVGIIIITDGVTSVPDVAVCETLLNQLRSGTIACSFVQVKTSWTAKAWTELACQFLIPVLIPHLWVLDVCGGGTAVLWGSVWN